MANTTLYYGGPAYGVWDSITWKFREDWKVTNPDQYFDIPSATGVGRSKGISDAMGKMSAQPKIFLSTLAAQLAALFPYTDPGKTGALVRPASDLPMVIHARNGGTSNAGLAITLYAAMLTKMPKLSFAPRKPLVDAVEWTYLQALGTAVGASASLIGATSSSYSEPTWAISDELYDIYTLTLGLAGTLTGTTASSSTAISNLASTQGLLPGMGVSGTGIPTGTTIASISGPTGLVLSQQATANGSGVTLTFTPLTIITDKDGIEFEPSATLEAIQPGQEPTRDYRLAEVKGTLRFRPHNMDVDNFYSTYFPETAKTLGMSIDQVGCPAAITGANAAGVNLAIPQVSRVKSGHDFSTKNPRTDKVELEAIQTVGDSTWQPLFTLGVN